jgi:uncharacterized protein
MLNVSRVPFSAPGVYREPESPLRALTGVRMDVCGFAGVAPRGPVRVPVVDEHWPDTRPCTEAGRPTLRSVAVAVESFDEYRRLYGGFEGPGLLPYAVASFFEQGGRRAWISRIVHRYGGTADSGGVATGILVGVSSPSSPAWLRARNEGEWGNTLQATLALRAVPATFVEAQSHRLTLQSSAEICAGCLLRLTLEDGSRVFRFVDVLERSVDLDQPRNVFFAYFDTAVAADPESVEVVEADIDIDDNDNRRERFERVGLHHAHPRWLAQVLCWESQLVSPTAAWAGHWLTPGSIDLVIPAVSYTADKPQFAGGTDRYADIVHADVIDASVLPDGDPGAGVNCFVQVDEVATLCIPDLYSPEPLVAFESIVGPASLAGATFERCVDLEPGESEQGIAQDDLEGLRLDPAAGDLDEIIELQRSVVAWAEKVRNFVVLLDVPPGLNHRTILQWRAEFDSSYAAAYHPWLTVARRDDEREFLIRVPPSAIAAGVIASTEWDFGITHGPANVLAREVVNVDDRVTPRHHDELHPQGINVYLQERDGIRLTAARTLSRDPQWRQLSVRRLLIMLRRVLETQMQWTVFEPNGSKLRLELTQLLRVYLRRLFRAGAFKGANEDEAFFVNCDGVLNTAFTIERGQVIAEIGVAPAEPIEFIVLRLTRDGDGTLSIEE